MVFINVAEPRGLLEEKCNYLKSIERGFIISTFKDSIRIRIQLAKNQQCDPHSIEILWKTHSALSMRIRGWGGFLEFCY